MHTLLPLLNIDNDSPLPALLSSMVETHTTGSSTSTSTRTTSQRATFPLILLDDKRCTVTGTTSPATPWRQAHGVYEMMLTNQGDYGPAKRFG